MTGRLSMWLGPEHVADALDAGAGLIALRFTPATVDRCTGDRLLSVRLPVRSEAYPAVEARPFFEGLAPEGAVRVALAERSRIATQDTFALLREYGRDCAGAIVFLPDDESPEDEPHEVRWLTSDELETRIRALATAPLAADPERGVRVSLGGVQSKLVVVMDGDRVGLPVGGTPSTHILKPQIFDDSEPRYPGIVEAECLALRAAAAAKGVDPALRFAVPSARVLPITERRTALVVERYDRSIDGHGVVRRLHQEDLCSALGIGPEAKYEHGSGGPNLAAVSDLLSECATNPLEDRVALLQLVTIAAQVGNADLHAKNLSVLLDGSVVRLAPLYDPVPTFLWPGTSRELGLRIGGQYHLDDLRADDVVEEGVRWGLGRRACRDLVHRTMSALSLGVDRALADAHAEGWHQPVLDTVVRRVVDEFPSTLS